MLEPPPIEAHRLIATLADHYGISASGLEFLPIGNDATAWSYKVLGGETYFLKVKRGALYQPSLSVPRHLVERGIKQVVAPLPTLTGALSAPLDDYRSILYPFVAGHPGMEIGLSPAQWRELGAALRRIHQTRLPTSIAQTLNRERFDPQWAPMVARLERTIEVGRFADDYQASLAAFWRQRSAEIDRITDRAATLGRRLAAGDHDFVLCHSDIHTANVIVSTAGALAIVDWDSPLLAPKERDLMFIVDSGGAETPHFRPEHESSFFEGYGPTVLDRVALAYYRYEWVVQEIGDFGERVFFGDGLGDATRQDALRGFTTLFAPGDVVDAAYRSDPDEQ